MLAAARTMADAGADVIDVADSPLARLRMSPWGACRVIEEQVGIETVLHFPTRGRNLLRLQGDLLAVHALGIRNIFVCLGDPVSIGDYPGGSDNVDVAPTGLIGLVTGAFNRGQDRAGASIGEPTSFLVGCALNPTAPDLEAECRLLHRKIQAGAAFALTQPVFSLEPLRRLRQIYEEHHGDLELPILAGVLPLVSSHHAEFLHNEVPGMFVPNPIRERMRAAGDRVEAEGLRLATELTHEVREVAAGIYVMPQFGRFDLAAEIVEAVGSG
jgi:homocysteine S-methyltransferase